MKRIYLLFLLCVLLFLLNQGMMILELPRPHIIVSYLNDFLAMPITLTLCLLITRYIHSNSSIRLSLFSVFSVAALYSVYFEYFLPGHSARYTADLVDVAMYFAGAFFFYLLQPSKAKRAQNESPK